LNTKNKFYLLLISIIFILTACNNNNEKNQIIKTDISINKNSVILENIINNVIQSSHISSTTTKIKNKKEEVVTSIFTFKNFENKTSILRMKNDVYNFINIEQSIVMINLASTWCPPCRGEVPHLNSLQKKFKKNLFILTTLVYDNIKDDELKKLIISEKVQFFVSTDKEENKKFEKMIVEKLGIVNNLKLPLMILFNNGKYFTHYEGSMPEEMIESDIRLLLKNKKTTKNKREK